MEKNFGLVRSNEATQSRLENKLSELVPIGILLLPHLQRISTNNADGIKTTLDPISNNLKFQEEFLEACYYGKPISPSEFTFPIQAKIAESHFFKSIERILQKTSEEGADYEVKDLIRYCISIDPEKFSLSEKNLVTFLKELIDNLSFIGGATTRIKFLRGANGYVDIKLGVSFSAYGQKNVPIEIQVNTQGNIMRKEKQTPLENEGRYWTSKINELLLQPINNQAMNEFLLNTVQADLIKVDLNGGYYSIPSENKDELNARILTQFQLHEYEEANMSALTYLIVHRYLPIFVESCRIFRDNEPLLTDTNSKVIIEELIKYAELCRLSQCR